MLAAAQVMCLTLVAVAGLLVVSGVRLCAEHKGLAAVLGAIGALAGGLLAFLGVAAFVAVVR